MSITADVSPAMRSPGSRPGAGPLPAGVEEQFEVLLLSVSLLTDREQVALANRFEQRLAAQRLLATARLTGSVGDARSVRKRARAVADVNGGSAGRSGRAAGRDARRAAAMATNEALRNRVADGSISGDGIDAALKAGDPDTGRIPGEVIDTVAHTPPDQAARLVSEMLAANTSIEEADERYAAQMAARRVRRYTTVGDGDEPPLAGLGIEGPDALIDELWSLICGDADTAYRAAGGRDRSAGDHVPLDHRRFDAAVGRIRGRGLRSARPQVVVTVPLDAAGLRDGAAVMEGSGPIGEELLAEYLGDGDLSVMLTGFDRRPLWLGRARRHASAAQLLALVVRDRGCVLCGARFQQCEAHHLMPWRSARRGATDLSNLALLCGPCHRRLHDTGQTLVRRRNPSGRRIWATRTAKPDERSAGRPGRVQRE